ncbi:SDR family NAD(P)-dependent oxidoreductase [Pseudomonadales bacterium]|nr:SDR family NAD(P)-dependent oxidoreductase [Pseudomonadales bacterium]MDB4362909.1 SDR family NAD(P)-dependent oxidoreductase [Pseudomonadales bacterium]MDB4528667.1 SDR family NAD(P)-dependent oxidoreductase [Pseudomonadales bacterium]
MSQSITLDETIQIDRPLQEVFDYVAEFSRIQEWDPAVKAARKLTLGAPSRGSEYQVDMKGGASLHYTVTEFESNKRLLMSVDSRMFSAVEEMQFAESSAGTTLRYIATFKFAVPLAMFNRLFPAVLQRVGKVSVRGLQRALEDDVAAPQASKYLALADKLVLPGVWRFTRLGYGAARKRWNPQSAYLAGRHAVITGATSGIGLAAAKQLAGRGARLTLVARNAEKAEQVAQLLSEETGNASINVVTADMSIMADVHALVARFIEAGDPIDILINNAGALFNPREETAEGLEKSFALLLLGPYILTEGVQPLLAKSSLARVVNVLSGGMYTQKIKVNDLQTSRGVYSGSVAYARAKRGLMILTQEWARGWSDAGIIVNAMHPGWVNTPGVVSALPEFYRVTRSVLRTPEQGADTITWLASATEAAKVSGKFWLDREQHPSHLSKKTRETPQQREQLLQALHSLSQSTRS